MPAPLTFLVLALSTAAGADWPRFRGPDGQGASAAEIPDAWPAETILWKTPLPGPGASAPIVLGDRVFVTCHTGYNVPGKEGGDPKELRRHLLCIGLEDGKIRLDKTVPAKLPEQDKIRESHGYASSTPVTDGERVYVFFGATGVLAFDLQGKELWRADVGSGLNGWGSAASPVLHGDLVLANASVESESLVALDRKSGKERWRTPGIKESWNTPIVVPTKDGKDEIVLAIAGKVLGVDPAGGKVLWSCETAIPWYMVPSLVAADGIVYCIGGRNGGGALAVRTGGRGDVTKTHRLWTLKKGSNVPSPVLHEGRLYWVNDVLGVAYCAEAATGKFLYEERLPGGDQFYASTTLVGNKLVHLSRSGKAFVLRAGPAFEVMATNDLKDRSAFNATPAVAGKSLLIRSDRFLVRIGKR